MEVNVEKIIYFHGSKTIPWEYVYFHGSWGQDDWWASGGSCGGVIVLLHLVGGSRVPNGETPPA